MTVLAEPAPGLVEWVESGSDTDGSARRELDEVLSAMSARGMDVLVLGCTHFSFLTDEIRSVVGDKVAIIDPSGAVARQVARVLEGRGVAAASRGKATVMVYTTDDPSSLDLAVRRLVGITDLPAASRW